MFSVPAAQHPEQMEDSGGLLDIFAGAGDIVGYGYVKGDDGSFKKKGHGNSLTRSQTKAARNLDYTGGEGVNPDSESLMYPPESF